MTTTLTERLAKVRAPKTQAQITEWARAFLDLVPDLTEDEAAPVLRMRDAGFTPERVAHRIRVMRQA